MQINRIKISELSLDPSNVRKHGRKNLDSIKASLRKFGQQKPIVVDAKGIVIAGNGTLAAAQELGWEEIDIIRTQLKGVEATMFAIADNRSAELAEWEDSLTEVLQKLQADGHDLSELGYDQNDRDELLARFQNVQQPAPESSTEEINIDKMQMQCRCPKCGFKFDPK